MRMETALGAAWSFPPPTCTSWRAESLPITGPYLTRERSPWANVSSHPPASPDMVRTSVCVWDENLFLKVSVKLNDLCLRYCVGGMFCLDRRLFFMLFWTLHGSICIIFAKANFF